MGSKVYFSRTITAEKVLELYQLLGKELSGNVAIKVHSGEPGNQNFLRPEFWKPVVDHVGGTVVECNTAYDGGRNTTERHLATFKKHGWSDHFTVDLLDAAGPDLVWEIPNGKKIKKNFVGKDVVNYDSMLVLSHFKGHPMGGFGGAIKQLSIGIASSYGKKYIHGVGDPDNFWGSDHDSFLEAMADAAVEGGMPRKQAYTFAAQAVMGSAKMVLETGIHPGELKDMVCSPAGTTIQAVRVLEEHGMRAAVMDAMKTCIDKSRNM